MVAIHTILTWVIAPFPYDLNLSCDNYNLICDRLQSSIPSDINPDTEKEFNLSLYWPIWAFSVSWLWLVRVREILMQNADTVNYLTLLYSFNLNFKVLSMAINSVVLLIYQLFNLIAELSCNRWIIKTSAISLVFWLG